MKGAAEASGVVAWASDVVAADCIADDALATAEKAAVEEVATCDSYRTCMRASDGVRIPRSSRAMLEGVDSVVQHDAWTVQAKPSDSADWGSQSRLVIRFAILRATFGPAAHETEACQTQPEESVVAVVL